MFFDNRTLLTLSSRGVPQLIEVVGTWGLASDTASHLVGPTSNQVKKDNWYDLDRNNWNVALE